MSVSGPAMAGSGPKGMSPSVGRAVAVVVGVAALIVGGVAAGGWWWVVAATGAGATLSGLSARRAAVIQAGATLALGIGVVASGRDWAVLALTAGIVVSLELFAAADRATRVRPLVPAPSPLRLGLALVPAPLVLWLGTLAPGPAVPLTVVAVLAGAGLVWLSARAG